MTIKVSAKVKEVLNYFENNLPSNYQIITTKVSTTNGLSIYIKIKRQDKDHYFTFRVSDHFNGFGVGIHKVHDGYLTTSSDINDMLAFYGDISENEARKIFLEKAISKYREKGYSDDSAAIAGLKKQLEELK